MSITKKDIVSRMQKEALISWEDGSNLLGLFLSLVKEKAKPNIVKLSGFGAFSFKKTPKRIGRNPKTKDSYIIQESNKLTFKPSYKIKKVIN